MEAENPSDVPPPENARVASNEPKEKNAEAHVSEQQQDLFTRTRRRKLPPERKSITHKFSVGGHEGYIIVGMYGEGAPGEIFIKMAKEGSTLSGFMDGVALSISIGLQYGVPLKALVDKLTNTRFEPSGFTENPNIRYASSVLDYIARWLGGKFLSPDYFRPRTAEIGQESILTTASKASREILPPSNRNTNADAPSCQTCGTLMIPNGNCYKCANCGRTSGCS
ncbi:MAG TPA: hypothetical protein VGU63_13180 [Candidatus Acidoferrales bacterium]|nr:hypothetical protein [Candidatus Acidoferrales bacterium]